MGKKKGWVFGRICEKESLLLLQDWLQGDPFLRPPGRKGWGASLGGGARAQPSRELWGLREGMKVRGCLLLDLYPRIRGAEVTVVVAPEFRRRGAGSFLLEEGCSRALSLGLEFLEVSVDQGNVGSVRLFEGHGFAPFSGAAPGMIKLRRALGG